MATDIISSIDAPVVQIINDQITTTSTDLAKCFGKRHSDVLRRVEKLECSAEFNERNFALVEYEDGKGESRPMYRITRDGFVFLAMGFTGAKAAQFKEAYINAFNQMEKHQIEKQLNEQKHLPATTDSTAVAETDSYSLQGRQLLNNIVKSMQIQSDPVVVPSKELIDLIQAVRLHQTQIAQLTLSLRQAYWVNDNIDRMKDYAQRSFVDF
ncbi:transcriptional regulator [Marinomonas rhizomae]|uniref:Rha family phage regulatory protein n=1 Tax=Marinomonas rhizomae TaxID=491948 RepID=A0A366IWE5_9GAMM|nr:Rha family transcriptional regulator [Marinomonas rhizomae]RBP79092.1 Rha family phage regulatory protein [Marinomonas rhizomae]RNF68571.1 transcriptional regulator [Marinomonas rhizomae]